MDNNDVTRMIVSAWPQQAIRVSKVNSLEQTLDDTSVFFPDLKSAINEMFDGTVKEIYVIGPSSYISPFIVDKVDKYVGGKVPVFEEGIE